MFRRTRRHHSRANSVKAQGELRSAGALERQITWPYAISLSAPRSGAIPRSRKSKS